MSSSPATKQSPRPRLSSAEVEVLGWRVMHGDGMTHGEREAAAKIILEVAAELRGEIALSSEIEPPTNEEIAAYRDLFRAELDKRMDTKHPSASPSTEAHGIALRRFVAARNARNAK